MSAPRDAPEHVRVQAALDSCDHSIEDARADIRVFEFLRWQLRVHHQCLLLGWPTAAPRSVAREVGS